MITLHIDFNQRDQIVQGLRLLADKLEDPTCTERAAMTEDELDAQLADVDDLRDMADLIEDAEDC